MSRLPHPLGRWLSSPLLQEACTHLRDQPEYVQMDPDAKGALGQFSRELRRTLMRIREQPVEQWEKRLTTLRAMSGLLIDTPDHKRYSVTIHGYTITLILDI